MPPTHATNKGHFLRTVVDVALLLHLAAAAAYWWRSPQGFPTASSRFWLNSALPIVLIAIAFVGLTAMHRRRWPTAAAVVLYFAWAWSAGAIAARVLFPISLRGIWLFALCIAAAGFLCFRALARGGRRVYPLWILSAATASLTGWFAVWAQVAPTASTQPANPQLPKFVAQEGQPVSEPVLRLGSEYEFSAPSAQLIMQVGRIRIQCRPLLDFDRISPDRFWSIFAPATNNYRKLLTEKVHASTRTIYYNDDSVVKLPAPSTDGTLRLTASTPLSYDTFSHVNTYCYFEIGGQSRLSLSFSPCPDAEIEVLPSDYPTGRPSRLAYLDSANKFHVVEASSGEKGPFRELATGPLKRGEPLTIAVHDKGRSIAWITLEDWSQQVSTELSPTAGWKLPMNAIEFRRFYDNPATPAAIWITLAATAVGRGWETVGHRAGVYRNGIKFQSHPPGDAGFE